MNDTQFMSEALELARKGIGNTSPNPLVGAVVVKNGHVIGRGWHETYGSHHAEVNALNSAGKSSAGATLYVTLEPCSHHGKTPPCVDRIIKSGISRVVIAMSDPNPLVNGRGIQKLKDSRIETVVGVCEKEAMRLNESFIKFITTRQPFVTIKSAITLDGMIATRSGDSKWISNESSRQAVHRMRFSNDAILVGVNTVNTDNPALTARLTDGTIKAPVRIVLDTHLSINESAQIIRQPSEAKTLIFTGPGTSREKLDRIERASVQIIKSPLKNGQINLQYVLSYLGNLSITSLLIEGGGQVIGSAVKAGIVDKIALFITPKILGGNDGVAWISGNGVSRISDCWQTSDTTLSRFGDDVLLESYFHPSVNPLTQQGRPASM